MKAVNWSEMLTEYKEGKKKMDTFSKKEICRKKDATSENNIYEAKQMSDELGDTIRMLNKHHLNECKSFLRSDQADILTLRQKEILHLRSQGFSFSQVGEKLGISKAAAHQSVKLSIKKIRNLNQVRNAIDDLPEVSGGKIR